MKEHSDATLLKHYRMGWDDSCDCGKYQNFDEEILNTAYEIGWWDFVVGDDATGTDAQTDEDILNHIKIGR